MPALAVSSSTTNLAMSGQSPPAIHTSASGGGSRLLSNGFSLQDNEKVSICLCHLMIYIKKSIICVPSSLIEYGLLIASVENVLGTARCLVFIKKRNILFGFNFLGVSTFVCLLCVFLSVC